ncbi:TetR/AcrR family transcriptional regulator [Halanaeroarchaeum sulfurireducens]|uniref:Transcriptional regulator, TetR family n=1 Tax=Halanaeroarchaeum sulfurireducens TaxID=1604004 RepID=A0A0F7PDG4_9EURY|nr:TetR/AcrR family transcriptional regulator [Halanaeroarchaeum sulfurireducens]AKH97378.1 transcriptional regulator, TetR family [Halanaeroarchaeum sulfurireducens]ALG81780.1 transcriptional regulator, TetR family [Halanaeroarchaeum sulfurireducens]
MDDPFPVDPDGDTRLEILKATYAAIDEHGYADLSMQNIADEFSKSKSLLYHHYDGKDDLLLDFLRFLQDRFQTFTDVAAVGDPDDRLNAFLDLFVPRESSSHSSPTDNMARVFVQLRAQAVQNPDYVVVFRESDERIRKRLREILRVGIEDGTFDASIDPDVVATFISFPLSPLPQSE